MKCDWERRRRRYHSEEVYSLYRSPNIVRVIKPRRWAGHMGPPNGRGQENWQRKTGVIRNLHSVFCAGCSILEHVSTSLIALISYLVTTIFEFYHSPMLSSLFPSLHNSNYVPGNFHFSTSKVALLWTDYWFINNTINYEIPYPQPNETTLSHC